MERKPSPNAKVQPPLPVSGTTEVLTVAEVAALLKVPPSSVYEWTRFRAHQRVPLPHRKVGKYLRFLRSEIEAWLIALPQASNTRKRKYTRKPDASIGEQQRKRAAA
jgi:excisionase family DNA binding protein